MLYGTRYSSEMVLIYDIAENLPCFAEIVDIYLCGKYKNCLVSMRQIGNNRYQWALWLHQSKKNWELSSHQSRESYWPHSDLT